MKLLTLDGNLHKKPARQLAQQLLMVDALQVKITKLGRLPRTKFLESCKSCGILSPIPYETNFDPMIQDRWSKMVSNHYFDRLQVGTFFQSNYYTRSNF